ncbi:Serine/threonine-protein kinase spk-1 [Tolypocladium ophioglossoides CBS 100239]|uniref:non-specific serine/threonine protein kinase n=1 Tax=Tolypocladium ophioglossoides (strain CBS 100239) TaxID=1163406 RepID=A0A0L0N7G9_TOLOC|nr:Serine/threonine-protein kinase spk-1 [Tolypocladium ophioglossoides CBS 100239]
MDSVSDFSPTKYFPCQLGDCEELEYYEPGGFHPVHLGDVFDGRYRVVHKLGFGGFSTVWLARDTVMNRWVALKIVMAKESAMYQARCTIASHPSIAGHRLFAVADGQFWVDGPNGRHLCLLFQVLGPDLSKLSKGIYSRMKPDFARDVSLQAARALAHLHSNGLCHGDANLVSIDFTTSNIALRLIDEFGSYEESDLLKLFGQPQTSPLIPYSGESPRPHAPDYNVVPLDFCSSTVNILSNEICIFDFDQSFTVTGPPLGRPGIPARYLAPEVAVGRPVSPASDIWALGCAIFRIRSGDELFFDYDTNCPEDALRQIVKAVGELPEEWKQTQFDKDGFALAEGVEGDPFWSLEETQPLEDRIRDILDEPASLFITDQGGALEEMDVEPDIVLFDVELTVPYPAAFGSIIWRPTAVCVGGIYFTGYSHKTEDKLNAFPKISASEAALLTDLLSKVFTYDPAKRFDAEELVTHPWFHPDVGCE